MKKMMGLLIMLVLPSLSFADATANNTRDTQVDTAAIRLSLAGVATASTDTAAIRLSLGSGNADTAALRLSLNAVSSVQTDTAATRLSLGYAIRPSQGVGRVHTTISISHITSAVTAATVYTVTTNKIFYVTSLHLVIQDSSAEVTYGFLKDGDTVKFPFEARGAVGGVVTSFNQSFQEPLQFDTTVLIAGSTTNMLISGVLVGFEE